MLATLVTPSVTTSISQSPSWAAPDHPAHSISKYNTSNLPLFIIIGITSHRNECLLLFLELQTFPLTRNVWETPAPQTCSHVRPVHPDSRVFTTI